MTCVWNSGAVFWGHAGRGRSSERPFAAIMNHHGLSGLNNPDFGGQRQGVSRPPSLSRLQRRSHSWPSASRGHGGRSQGPVPGAFPGPDPPGEASEAQGVSSGLCHWRAAELGPGVRSCCPTAPTAARKTPGGPGGRAGGSLGGPLGSQLDHLLSVSLHGTLEGLSRGSAPEEWPWSVARGPSGWVGQGWGPRDALLNVCILGACGVCDCQHWISQQGGNTLRGEAGSSLPSLSMVISLKDLAPQEGSCLTLVQAVA